MINESFSIRLREARQMMGLSMDKLVERTSYKINSFHYICQQIKE